MKLRTLPSILAAAILIAAPPPAVAADPRRPSSSASVGSEMDELLGSHIEQANRIETETTRRGDPPELRRAVRKLTTEAKGWQRRIEGDAKHGGLLEGIDPSLVRGVARKASDPAQLIAQIGQGVSLPWILTVVAHRNPEVLRDREGVRATIRQFEQSAYLEDLVAQTRAFTREVDTVVGPGTNREMLSKVFPFPASLALRGVAVDQSAQIARQRSLATLRTKLNEAARLFYELQYSRRVLGLTVEIRGLFEDMGVASRARLQVGLSSQADALKVDAEVARIKAQVEVLQQSVKGLTGRLEALMDLRGNTSWESVTESAPTIPSGTIDELVSDGRSFNQEVKIKEGELELARTMLRLAETMLYTRGPWGASVMSPGVGAEAGPTRNEMATFPDRPEVSLSAAGFGTGAAYLDELRVRIGEAQAALDGARARVQGEIERRFRELEAASRNHRAYSGSVVPSQRQAFQSLREAYTTGKSPFLDYLDAGRTYLESAMRREELERDRNFAIVDLQEERGRSTSSLLEAKSHGF